MQTQFESEKSVDAQVRDARDLLTRLYREIGISAVAAALEVRTPHRQHARPGVEALKPDTKLAEIKSRAA